MARIKFFLLTSFLLFAIAGSAQIPGGFYKEGEKGMEKRTEGTKLSELEMSPLIPETDDRSGQKGRFLFLAMSDDDKEEKRLYFFEVDQKEEEFLSRLLRYFKLNDELMMRKGDELPELNRLFVRRS